MTNNNLNIGNSYSEVRPFDDYRKKFKGFRNPVRGRATNDTKKWADDTHKLAKYSFYLYCLEAPLKFVRHFVESSDYKNSFIANIVYSAERLFGMSGDISRNLIYGHRDSNGNRDDNLGAQEHGRKELGDSSKISIGNANYYSQTGGKLLLVALGLFNSELANDIEWAGVNALDKWWWRSMGTDLAYGPNFGARVFNTITGKDTSNDNKITWGFIKSQFSKHITNARNSFSKFTQTSKANATKRTKHLLDFCQNSDKVFSAFSPLVSALTIFGSIARPIARRMDIQGFSRGLFRILSEVDKPLMWVNHLFRFYIPEKAARGNKDPFARKDKLFSFFDTPDLLAASTLLSMTGFTSLFFEKKVKEKSGNIEHLIELSRKLTKSFEEGYFALRRTYAANDMETEQKQALYEKTKEQGLS